MIHAVMSALLVCCLLCAYRVIRGPTLLDRIVAADAIGVILTTVLVLLGHSLDRHLFLDVALVYAVLLFADVLIIARYLEQKGGAP